MGKRGGCRPIAFRPLSRIFSKPVPWLLPEGTLPEKMPGRNASRLLGLLGEAASSMAPCVSDHSRPPDDGFAASALSPAAFTRNNQIQFSK